MDYVNFFGFREAPFKLLPNSRFFYDGASHRRAFSYLTFGLNKAEGFVVITGEIGAGKTAIIDRVLKSLPKSRVRVGRVAATQFGADDFLRVIAHAFGLETERRDKATVHHALENLLIEARQEGRRPLLFVDEAQGLPRSALEELRMLSNLQHGEQSLLQIFLVGQPELRSILARPDLDQLRQRIVARYHLTALEGGEIQGYVMHRLKIAGWQGVPQFDEDCFPVIYRETGGVPRKINKLCDRIFWFAYLEEKKLITRADVVAVIEELRTEDYGSRADADEILGDNPDVSLAEHLLGAQPPAPEPSEQDANVIGIDRAARKD